MQVIRVRYVVARWVSKFITKAVVLRRNRLASNRDTFSHMRIPVTRRGLESGSTPVMEIKSMGITRP